MMEYSLTDTHLVVRCSIVDRDDQTIWSVQCFAIHRVDDAVVGPVTPEELLGVQGIDCKKLEWSNPPRKSEWPMRMVFIIGGLIYFSPVILIILIVSYVIMAMLPRRSRSIKDAGTAA